ncbi:MAG: AAA family ATPase [Anaerolineaceae bacterium]|nr:AAA family ATPase [Anaerolineaceae bacterium]
MNEKIHIHLLGIPIILFNDEPVIIKRKSIRFLLYYLACQEHAVNREDLMVAFFPNEEHKIKQNRMADMLSKLRKSLPLPHVLYTKQGQVELIKESVYIDIHEFRNKANDLIERARSYQKETPLPEALYIETKEILNLWNYPVFMSGVQIPQSVNIDKWFQNLSHHIENQQLTLLEKKSFHEALTGKTGPAIQSVKELIEVDNSNVEAHYLLLSLFNQSGQQKDLIRHYEQIEKLYKQENPLELPPRIQQFYEKSKRNTIPDKKKQPNIIPSFHNETPFIGRDNEIKLLSEAFSHGGIILISGEAGVGKSRLAKEFIDNLDKSIKVYDIPSYETDKRIPFLPFIHILRDIVSPEIWIRVNSIWISHLNQIIPELSSIRPEVRPARHLGENNALPAIFEAIHQALLTDAGSQSFVYQMSNFQWCDEVSLNVFKYLLQENFFSNNRLLLLTIRSEERIDYIEDFILDLPQLNSSSKIILLENLSNENIKLLIEKYLRFPISIETLNKVVENTGGNPTFLVEVLQSYKQANTGFSLEEYLTKIDFSSGIKNLIQQRINQLSRNTYQVLITAAIIGYNFSTKLVEMSCSLNMERVADALEDLEWFHIIKPLIIEGKSPNYHFTQKIFREIVIQGISPVRKRLLHFKIARVLEEKNVKKGVLPSIIAYHLENAGEYKEAFKYWLDIGLHNQELMIHREAYKAYQKAESFVKTDPYIFTDDEIYKLYASWGYLSDEINDQEMMAKVYSILRRFGEQRKSALLTGSGLSGLASKEYKANQFEKSFALIESAIFYLGQTENKEEIITAFNRKALLLAFMNRYAEADKFLQDAKEIGKNSNDQKFIRSQLVAEQYMAGIFNMRGLADKAIMHANNTLRTSMLRFDTPNIVYAHERLATANYLMGNYDTALIHCEFCLSKSKELQVPTWEIFSNYVSARAHAHLGQMTEAWDHIHNVLYLSEHYKVPDYSILSYCRLGDIFRTVKQIDKSIEYYEKGLELGGIGYYYLETKFRMGLSMLADKDLHEKGAHLIQEVIPLARDSQFSHIYLLAELLLAGNYFVPRNEYKKAEELFTSVSKELKETYYSMKPVYLHNVMEQAKMNLQKGNYVLSLEMIKEVIKGASNIHYRWIELQAYHTWYKLNQASGKENNLVLQKYSSLYDYIFDHTNSDLREGFELSFRIST